jgi:signal transduction histidine kinase/ABC-type amino acid transport substrate-binding protein/ActR/RegA family two-component response regulator
MNESAGKSSVLGTWRSHVFRFLFCMAILSAFLILPVFKENIYAAEPQTPVKVRAGYFNNGDFMHKAEDGSYAGYDIEYYYTIAGYAGWDIDFVEYPSLTDALAALKSGDIDILSGLSKTPEREQSYITSSSKMCTSRIAVQTRADDDRFSPGDPSTMQDMTCGILKKSNVIALYSDWCARNGLTPHIVEYDSLDQRNEAFAAGKVDAIAAGSTIEGAQKIAEFPSLDLFFMLNPSRTDLQTQLDTAMQVMALQNPVFAQNLFEKYFPSSRNSAPSFSKSEKAFIASHPVVKVALLKNDAPFSEQNKDGTLQGVLPAYYDHLADVTGMTFSYVPCSSLDDACDRLADGSADLIGKVTYDVYDANSRGILLSNPYLSMNMVEIIRAGKSSVSSAAVPVCNAAYVSDMIHTERYSLSVKEFENASECFRAMRSRQTDSVICSQQVSTWLLSQYHASEFIVSSFGNGTWDISCGLPSSDAGNQLRSIFDKSVAVDGSYIDQLIESDILRISSSPAGILSHLSVTGIISLAAAAVAVLLIIIVAMMVLVRNEKVKRKLEARQAELKIADEANKSRRMFFGNVSHDMRTPLNGIMGFTRLALQSSDMTEVRNYLEKIQTSGSVLTALVNDTLTVSRAENGTYKVHPSPNDLKEVLSELLDPVRESMSEKKVIFCENVSDLPHCLVMADRLSLQKIFLNLLANAVKFTPAGGKVTFLCRCSEEKDGIYHACFTVSDTGTGMSEEFRPHAFEPYTQEDSSTAGNNGVGMGLSIVKSIVDAMHGTVSVESSRTAGTTFTVELPLEKCVSAQSGPEPAADEQRPDRTVLKGRHVLVCEDNELNMEIMKTVLENAGMEVTCAENGKTGTEKFAESKAGYFDCILLDLRMPVMDGNASARAIRAMDRPDAGTVRIYAVSADAFRENVEEAEASGMNGHFAKPVDADILLDTLAKDIKDL